MRNYNTEAELMFIPNVDFKRESISDNYIRYCDYTSPQGYLMEQLELNPQLLAWIFDDDTLIGKSYFALDTDRYEAFQDFYESFNIDYEYEILVYEKLVS